MKKDSKTDEIVEQLINELTTSGAAGSYDVPLGTRPVGRRKQPTKKPETIEYK